MDVADQTGALCVLALRAGREETCAGEVCPLWEQGACALERMTADPELFVDRWPEDEPV